MFVNGKRKINFFLANSSLSLAAVQSSYDNEMEKQWKLKQSSAVKMCYRSTVGEMNRVCGTHKLGTVEEINIHKFVNTYV